MERQFLSWVQGIRYEGVNIPIMKVNDLNVVSLEDKEYKFSEIWE
jgi:hypothetical protein